MICAVESAPRCEQSATALLRRFCCASRRIASKNWVYRQYDHMVRAGTVVLPGSDAAVFLVREANKFLAATSDCNALYCALDPREGARIAVAEAARNLACCGRDAARRDRQPQLRQSRTSRRISGSCARASKVSPKRCRAFDTPVTGGNV